METTSSRLATMGGSMCLLNLYVILTLRLVRKWDWTGSVTQICRGHEDYVYEVKCYPEISLSCGEDHTAVS